MFDFFPQILIIVAVVGIIIIIVRKYPEASKLKDNEKEDSSKNKTFWGRILTVIKYIGRKIKQFSVTVFKNIYPKAKNIRKGREIIQPQDDIISLSKNKPVVQKDQSEKEILENKLEEENEIVDLLEEAAEFLGSDNYQEAEKKYIEIVKLDPKNIRAYKGLGKVYKEQGNIKDAKSSYEQVLVIKPGDSEAKEELKKIQLGD